MPALVLSQCSYYSLNPSCNRRSHPTTHEYIQDQWVFLWCIAASTRRPGTFGEQTTETVQPSRHRFPKGRLYVVMEQEYEVKVESTVTNCSTYRHEWKSLCLSAEPITLCFNFYSTINCNYAFIRQKLS